MNPGLAPHMAFGRRPASTRRETSFFGLRTLWDVTPVVFQCCTCAPSCQRSRESASAHACSYHTQRRVWTHRGQGSALVSLRGGNVVDFFDLLCLLPSICLHWISESVTTCASCELHCILLRIMLSHHCQEFLDLIKSEIRCIFHTFCEEGNTDCSTQ